MDKKENRKNFRHKTEYGSARWGKKQDIEPFVDPIFKQNVILTQTESLTMNSRPENPANARNKNCLIVGGSGSGKTRFWIKPNLLQLHSSYVLTDPKGTREITAYDELELDTLGDKKTALFLIMSDTDLTELQTKITNAMVNKELQAECKVENRVRLLVTEREKITSESERVLWEQLQGVAQWAPVKDAQGELVLPEYQMNFTWME